MALQKHARELMSRIKDMGLAADIANSKVGGHYTLTVVKDGHEVRVPVACSPSDRDTCINAVLRLVRRRFLERGIQL